MWCHLALRIRLAVNQVAEEYLASVVMVGDVALDEVNLETSASLPKLLYALTGYVLSSLCSQLTLEATCAMYTLSDSRRGGNHLFLQYSLII